MKFIQLITMFVLSGACLCHASVVRVPEDYPNIQAGIDATVDGDTVVVADGLYTGEGNSEIDLKGKAIRVRSANGPEMCILEYSEGNGFIFQENESRMTLVEGLTLRGGDVGINCSPPASPVILNCRIESMHWTGILCTGYCYPLLADCMVTNCAGNIGAMQFIAHGSGIVFNCLVAGNDTNGIAVSETSDLVVRNSTFTGNNGYGIVNADGASASFINCIIWNNTLGAIEPGPWSPETEFCNLDDYDPLFVTGPEGNYYLSQAVAGQTQTSSSVDAGSGPADSDCVDIAEESVCMNQFTSRTDQIMDTGILDLGFHYGVPSQTPTPSPTPDFRELGVSLEISSLFFEDGDPFHLSATVINPTRTRYPKVRLYIALNVADEYFFWPSWSEMDSVLIAVEPESEDMVMLMKFIWPPVDFGMTGAWFMAGMVDTETDQPLGEYSMVVFGWAGPA